ncbi:MAG: DUF3341 domain-containing protein [Methylocystis sp.]|uniref:DUF3341 domain-containing protein n=1 Tax=Methylocystis sp. TaxID=1911079 RepID=UPI0039268548
MNAETKAPNGLAATFLTENASFAALAALNAADVGDARLFSPLPPPGPPKRTRLPALALVFGLLGAAGAFGLQAYANVVAYPLDIGGRPPFSWPSFIPIAFEAGILAVVLATFVGAGALCGFTRYYDSIDEIRALRDATIDRWVIVIRASNVESLARSRDILERCGARAIEEAEL